MSLKQYDNVNFSLLHLVPQDAKTVLELGCSSAKLAEVFKANHPGTYWTGVDVSSQALSSAIGRVDDVVLMDLNDPRKEHLVRADYDTIVMGDVLEHLADPIKALKFAHDVSSDNAQVLCCMPIMTNIGVIERMLYGDLSYDMYGLLDSTHLRFMSIASTIKLFLDAGWAPNIENTIYAGIGSGTAEDYRFTDLLRQAAAVRGIPGSTVDRNLFSYQVLIKATKIPKHRPAPRVHSFSVVVPVTNPLLYNLNVERSPGLQEVGAQLIPIYGATSAADAFAQGAEKATNEWILFCHQDVYVPAGSGFAIATAIEDHLPETLLAGFVGYAEGEQRGLVIDRVHKLDHAPDYAKRNWQITSIDEFAVIMGKHSAHEIDPALGWHLWATDLCIEASKHLYTKKLDIKHIPLFHNSLTESSVSGEYEASREVFKEKHKGYGTVKTLADTFEA